MKILWHSVHPSVGSGYGMGTKIMTRALRDAGHEVVISCSFGQQGYTSITEDGITCLPCGQPKAYGNDTVTNHFKFTRSDIVLSLLDIFVFIPDIWAKLPWAALLMIDSDPIMSRNIDTLNVCKWPLAVSRFGEKMLEKADIEHHMYWPLMVDDDLFRLMDQEEARKILSKTWGVDLGDRFLVVVNSANVGIPGRKNFGNIFEAWQMFSKEHPDALMYLHTDVSGSMQGGMDLEELAKLYDVNLNTLIIPPSWQYSCGMIGEDALNLVYNASDMLLNPSVGEGFGLPAIEAQLCGCPVVVSDFAADSEHCFAGLRLSGKKTNKVPGALQIDVPVEQIYGALVYMADNEIGKMWDRENTRRQAQEFSVESVMTKYAKPVLARIESELGNG